MLLRHPREIPQETTQENCFEAVEERTGERMGLCYLRVENSPVLFPARPYSVRLILEGSGAQEALLGAAMARARIMCLASGKPARMYTACPATDTQQLQLLNAYGFKDNDGLVRMCKDLPTAPMRKLPAGCIVVKDDLSDPIEQKYFIDRFEQLFPNESGAEWIKENAGKPGFTRILTVSPTGLVGEIVLWKAPFVGIVGYLQTSKRWRRMGIAKYMLSLADEYFAENGLSAVQADARARIPNLLHTLEAAGYRQQKLLMRYPGIDLP